MKTVVVTVAFRAPKKMRRDEIEAFLCMAIKSESAHYPPDTSAHNVTLYRDRVEVFMP